MRCTYACGAIEINQNNGDREEGLRKNYYPTVPEDLLQFFHVMCGKLTMLFFFFLSGSVNIISIINICATVKRSASLFSQSNQKFYCTFRFAPSAYMQFYSNQHKQGAAKIEKIESARYLKK